MASATEASPTYAEVEATAGPAPAGYHRLARTADLGGAEVFDRAVEAVRGWEAHRGAGTKVLPVAAPLEVGVTVLVVVRLAVVTVVAPCRIVAVTDEPDRFGFAYRTLPGHPATGEEAFHVVRADSRTCLEIVAFSKPADPLMRLVPPLARFVQAHYTDRYIAGLRAFVDPAR
ncbi:MAG: DUF1990 domain-containing protein [Acidimicrobiales bacterium]